MTVQSKDSLIFKGKRYSINANLSDLDLLKHLDIEKYRAESSRNWRGYSAQFIIRNNFFCLNEIFLHNDDEQGKIEQTLQKFYSKYEDGRIDWLNDIIILDEDNTIRIILEISNGSLSQVLYCNEEEFEELEKTQFKNFIGSDEYKRKIEFYLSMNDQKNAFFTEEKIVGFMEKNIFSYSTKLY
ncbi:hypothetical protein BA768_03840 [Chryseobacterium sp. CBo1]|uniref:hypothetical protein n=1 Tax=Chryseobacterium sp. CBo1 TaxID=1869230 RepID=UPI000810F15E|nr:hypothetical protein [Chryseobacterium sp. CBo1]OCK50927.1 hypothetical protein BA768_03840 [Chryseobacterium sp. CBo1]